MIKYSIFKQFIYTGNYAENHSIVAETEKALAINFPDDYKYFISNYDNPNVTIWQHCYVETFKGIEYKSMLLHSFFTIEESLECLNRIVDNFLPEIDDEYEINCDREIWKQLWPICYSMEPGNYNPVCIGVSSVYKGRIFIFDINVKLGVRNNQPLLIPLANSLTELILSENTQNKQLLPEKDQISGFFTFFSKLEKEYTDIDLQNFECDFSWKLPLDLIQYLKISSGKFNNLSSIDEEEIIKYFSVDDYYDTNSHYYKTICKLLIEKGLFSFCVSKHFIYVLGLYQEYLREVIVLDIDTLEIRKKYISFSNFSSHIDWK
jgi:hypothetical protein